MSEETSDKQYYSIEEAKRKFREAIEDFASSIKLKQHKRGDKLLRMQKSFKRGSVKWNKTYLSNYISKY